MDRIIVLIIFSSPVVIYLYSANTRINLTARHRYLVSILAIEASEDYCCNRQCDQGQNASCGSYLAARQPVRPSGGHHLITPLPDCDRRTLLHRCWPSCSDHRRVHWL